MIAEVFAHLLAYTGPVGHTMIILMLILFGNTPAAQNTYILPTVERHFKTWKIPSTDNAGPELTD